MATRKKTQPAPTPEERGREIIAALDALEAERGISKTYMLGRVSQALAAAYRALNKPSGTVQDGAVEVHIDPETGALSMQSVKTVVEEVSNPASEVSLAEAQRIDPTLELGGVLRQDVPVDRLTRVATQTAKQVIIQGIREAERGMIADDFSSKEHELLNATVLRVDEKTGKAYLEIVGKTERTETILFPQDMVPGEKLTEGSRIRVYVSEVRNQTKGPQIVVSRTNAGMVARLFELEVPEIKDGTVRIVSIAREAGSRSKMAVWSNNPDVDPIGACVGPQGGRVNAVVDELGGEKIDLIKYSKDPVQYVAEALSPADVLTVQMSPDGHSCVVVVDDDQLSLAIGREGQNARLAARLTGYKIDIRPSSAAGGKARDKE